MANTYDYGDEVRLTATFTDSNGDAQDPSAAVIWIIKPDNDKITYKSATGWTSQGNWDASTNTPTLANGTGTAGHFYSVNVAGTADLGDGPIAFVTTDQIGYNGDIWIRLAGVASGTLTKSSTGIYYYDQPVTQASAVEELIFRYGSLGIGTGQAGEQTYFKVSKNKYAG